MTNSNAALNFLSVGKIANTHGVRGELKIFPFTDFPEVRFAKGKELILTSPEEGTQLKVKIVSAREQKTVYIVKLEGYDNINQVEKYKGWEVKVPKEEAVEAEDNAYYFHEIIGCTVWTEQGEELGSITDILTPGANDVWVVKRKGGKELLIPFIESVVKEVNIAEKKVRIELMEGLLD
ncbi:ribosome maturation factor RimM [Saccharibacillus sp. JS10]|uniref:ribosome maturation factor RimM n=1 Tax=Saccharibacillus sp. JS10 TaxID=2950552 RepID=UPI00210C7F10|nr:ribosome maturation factor RimM [Saccharibacillus sp. JS10]MCQ4087163.1 ribosome maturation factor RimM [Saccharibacillus sp. JS10]